MHSFENRVQDLKVCLGLKILYIQKQFKVQIIGILEEKDSVFIKNALFEKVQGPPPPPSLRQCPKECNLFVQIVVLDRRSRQLCGCCL